MAGSAPILLLSMPQMMDPNFAKTVVLLTDYTDEGAFGLVVNRQMEEPAWTLVKTEPPVRVDPDLKSEAQGPDEEQREICPGVLLSVSKELTLQLLQSPPSPRARVLVGYAGWERGQLDREIAASAWLTMDVDASLIFNTPPDQMWETALRRLGADPSALQSTSGGIH
jgi:putative transcriptional regulator